MCSLWQRDFPCCHHCLGPYLDLPGAWAGLSRVQCVPAVEFTPCQKRMLTLSPFRMRNRSQGPGYLLHGAPRVKTKILSWALNCILPHISWAPPVSPHFPVRLNDLGSEETLVGPRGYGAAWSSRARVQWEANRAEASVHFGNIWLLRMFCGKLVSPHLWVLS